MQPDEAQALANLLPLLICGEESATFVFNDLATALQDKLSPALISELCNITHDEMRHANYLEVLRNSLPAPTDRQATARTLVFLTKLRSPRPEYQLARLAALDSAVCMILSAVLRRSTPIGNSSEVRRLLRCIQLDEAHHVRITRECMNALGVSETQSTKERAFVLHAFERLLRSANAELECLHVNLNTLASRWQTMSGSMREPALMNS